MPSWSPAPRAPRGSACSLPFAGAVHAARAVRKADSTAPDAFASPAWARSGACRRPRLDRPRVERFPPVPFASLDATVHIVPAALAADGTLVDAALEAGTNGPVGVVLSTDHAPPPFLAALRRAAAQVPVVATVRPAPRWSSRRRAPSRAPSATCDPAR